MAGERLCYLAWMGSAIRSCPLKLFAVVVALWFGAVGSAFAACPSLGPIPRSPFGPADAFAHSGEYSLDSAGILVFDYKTAYNNLGKYHNAYFISNYAAALYHDYLQSGCADSLLRQKFDLQANWLLEHGKHMRDMLLWTYDFPYPKYGLGAGWFSGIGQARIAGVLEREYALSGDAKYRAAAEAAMQPYLEDLRQGGAISRDNGVAWIEEAPDPEGKSYRILNGHITALSGILDFYQITGEQKWRDLFNQGVAAVARDLPKFDAGFTSFYSLDMVGADRFAAIHDYNALHVEQLLWLYDQVQSPEFLEWASRFEGYETAGNTYTASGSVDPVRHGPDQAGGFYGSAYWSDAKFPAQLTVTLPKAAAISGVEIDGDGAKSTPRDFAITAETDQGNKELFSTKDNSQKLLRVQVDPPAVVSSITVMINKDNGNNNVALQAFVPIRAEPTYGAITNDCNWRTNLYEFFDHSGKMNDMPIRCNGWLILPTHDAKTVAGHVKAAPGSILNVSFADRLDGSWTKERSVPVGTDGSFEAPTEGAFARLAFTTDIEAFNDFEAGR